MERKVISEIPGKEKKEAANLEEIMNAEPTKLPESEEVKQHINEENKKSKYSTLRVELPSRGLAYPESSPLSSGVVEMKYMTAKEEDILTTEQYIKDGIVLDKLINSLIVTPINYDELLIGDRDALMVNARIYGYGDEYTIKVKAPSGNEQGVIVTLSEIPNKDVDYNLLNRDNLYTFTCMDDTEINFKLLTAGDEKAIQEALKKQRRKLHKKDTRDRQLTTRLFHMIESVDGNDNEQFIRGFIETQFRSLDSRKFREYIAEIQPGLDMDIDVVDEATGDNFRSSITIGLDFLWPDVGV